MQGILRLAVTVAALSLPAAASADDIVTGNLQAIASDPISYVVGTGENTAGKLFWLVPGELPAGTYLPNGPVVPATPVAQARKHHRAKKVRRH